MQSYIGEPYTDDAKVSLVQCSISMNVPDVTVFSIHALFVELSPVDSNEI